MVVKKGQQGQKFRIPFKNNGPQELDIDFTFAKQSAVIVGPEMKNRDSEGNDENLAKAALMSPIEFAAMPSNAKIPPGGSAILNIAAKLKNSFQLASIKEDETSKTAKP